MAMKVLTRAATPGDYKKVLEMNTTVYEGFDYLPTYYHLYQHDPHSHPFVGEVKGNIVGYFVLRITDGGQTALSVAGRVDPAMNGQGVFGQMVPVALKMVLQRVPTVKYIRHNAYGAKHLDVLEKAAKTGDAPERIMLKYNLLAYSEKHASSEYNLDTNDAVELCTDDAEFVFSDVTNLVGLFPTGIIVCYQNSRPLRVNYQTIMDIARSHYTVCSFRESSRTKLCAVSFGFICQIPLGVKLDIYFYDVISDVKILRQHIIKQVKHVMSLTLAGVCFNVLLLSPKGYAVEDVKGSLKEYLGENLVNTTTFKRQYAIALEGLVVGSNNTFYFGVKSKI